MNVDFLKVHFLAHRFSHNEAYNEENLVAFAVEALNIMDRYKALHPSYPNFQAKLSETGHPEAARFLAEWAKKIESEAPKTSYLVELDEVQSTDKQQILDEFKQVFAVLVIQCDFRLVQFYLGKLDNIAIFPAQVTSAVAFSENRFFEHLFYQLVALIFGRIWFAESSTPKKDNEEPFGGPTGPRNVSSVEKKASNYHTRCGFLFRSLEDKPEADVDAMKPELEYHMLVQWLCALVKFTQGKFQAFSAEFDCLYEHISVLENLGVVSETMAMYAVTSIATKPFNQLSLNSNEALVDAYTSVSGTLEQDIFHVLSLLSNAEFAPAKAALFDQNLLRKLGASLAVFLPNSFEDFLTRLCCLIDQKAFLLILSITKRIRREKLLSMLGYSPQNQTEFEDVSNRLLLLIAVLSLGESSIVYETQSDLFCYRQPSEAERTEILQAKVDELTHDVRAEASAAMLKAILIKKHFDQ